MTTAGQLLVFEGYDGSGKSTLIHALRGSLPDASFLTVGRKGEPELHDIARILEREDHRPKPRTEMLLRLSVEFERLSLVKKALDEYDFVVCDRGVTSMVAWFDYLGADRVPFVALLADLREFYRDALTVLAVADFDTCWERSSSRAEQSRKDRLGKDVNRQYFDHYTANVQSEKTAGVEFLSVDTVADTVSESATKILGALR